MKDFFLGLKGRSFLRADYKKAVILQGDMISVCETVKETKLSAAEVKRLQELAAEGQKLVIPPPGRLQEFLDLLHRIAMIHDGGERSPGGGLF